MANVIDTKEIDDFAKQLSKLSAKTQENVSRAVKTFALLIDRKSKEKIQKGTRSGRTYKRGTISHRASADGEPPKTDTGRLVSSIRPVFGNMSAEVGSLANIAKYGDMLERGTKNMAARPWLEPTLQENSDALGNLITAAIKGGGLG
jgi:HK97 gp10 family phage protein